MVLGWGDGSMDKIKLCVNTGIWIYHRLISQMRMHAPLTSVLWGVGTGRLLGLVS